MTRIKKSNIEGKCITENNNKLIEKQTKNEENTKGLQKRNIDTEKNKQDTEKKTETAEEKKELKAKKIQENLEKIKSKTEKVLEMKIMRVDQEEKTKKDKNYRSKRNNGSKRN